MIQSTHLRFAIFITLFILATAMTATAQDTVIGIDAELLSAETGNLVVGERAFYNVTVYNTKNETLYLNFTVEVKSPSEETLISKEHNVSIPTLYKTSVIPEPSLPGGIFQSFLIKENGVYTITVDSKDVNNVLITCVPFSQFNYTGGFNYTALCDPSAYTYQIQSIENIVYVPTPQEDQIEKSSEAIAKSSQKISEILQIQTVVLEDLQNKGTKLQQATLLAALLAVFVAIASQWQKIKESIFKATLEGTKHSEFWKIRERAKRLFLPFSMILAVAFILKLGGWSFIFDIILAAGLGTYFLLLSFLGADISSFNYSVLNITFGLLIAASIWILLPSLFYVIRRFVNEPIRSFLRLNYKANFWIYVIWGLIVLTLYFIGVKTESEFFFRLLIIPFLFAFELVMRPQE